MAGLGPVAHRHLAVDDVPVAASDPLDLDESRLSEVADDPLRGALGDPDHRGDVAGPDVRVARDAQQDLHVVRQEAPTRPVRLS